MLDTTYDAAMLIALSISGKIGLKHAKPIDFPGVAQLTNLFSHYWFGEALPRERRSFKAERRVSASPHLRLCSGGAEAQNLLVPLIDQMQKSVPFTNSWKVP